MINHTKGLKVTFRDGTVMCERSAKDTMVRVLQKIGFYKVALSGIKHDGGYCLVSKTMSPVEGI